MQACVWCQQTALSAAADAAPTSTGVFATTTSQLCCTEAGTQALDAARAPTCLRAASASMQPRAR